jgi:hypothetical protein
MSGQPVTVDAEDLVAVLGRLVAVAQKAEEPVGSPLSAPAFDRLRDAVGGPMVFEACTAEVVMLRPPRKTRASGGKSARPRGQDQGPTDGVA